MIARRTWLVMALLASLVIVATAAGCGAATPEVIEKEVVVEKKVVETVIVEKEVAVEKEVGENRHCREGDHCHAFGPYGFHRGALGHSIPTRWIPIR